MGRRDGRQFSDGRRRLLEAEFSLAGVAAAPRPHGFADPRGICLCFSIGAAGAAQLVGYICLDVYCNLKHDDTGSKLKT